MRWGRDYPLHEISRDLERNIGALGEDPVLASCSCFPSEPFPHFRRLGPTCIPFLWVVIQQLFPYLIAICLNTHLGKDLKEKMCNDARGLVERQLPSASSSEYSVSQVRVVTFASCYHWHHIWLLLLEFTTLWEVNLGQCVGNMPAWYVRMSLTLTTTEG